MLFRSQAASRASHGEYRGTVSSISQDSPISINLIGLKEAVELVLTYVIPWRRRNAERLASLEIEKREIELQREKHGVSMLPFDQEQRRLQLLQVQLDLAKSKLELAERMLKVVDPEMQLRGESREIALSKLLSGVDHMTATRMEFQIVHEERPRG